MFRILKSNTSRLVNFCSAIALISFAGSLHAAAPPVASAAGDAASLRICSSQVEAPFSSKDGSGFENRIAIILAEAMGRKPVVIWTEKPAIFLVRDFLDKNACDVVMGLDAGDSRVLTSAPYYRSGYVFLSRADQPLDIKSWKDERIEKLGHIAVTFGSPAEAMLHEVGKYEDDVAYLYSLVNFRSPRNQYTQVAAEKLVGEVVSGNADLAVAFAPEVARYVKQAATPLRMTMIADDNYRSDGQKVPHHFDQSIGVRKGDEALLEQVNIGLAKARAKIEAVLEEEGIPLLDKGL